MSEPNTSSRPRFSLLSLLLLVSFIAMAIALYLAYSELVPMRREVRQLRDNAGVLSIDDPSKLQAIAVDTYTHNAWKWRVWIPAGKKYSLRFAGSQIPKKDLFPDVHQSLRGDSKAEGHEIEVVARIEKRLSGQLLLAVNSGSVTTYHAINEKDAKWLVDSSSGWTSEGVGKSTTVAKSDSPFVLMRRRVFYRKGSVPPTPQPDVTDGVLIWIEER